ncbi:hypothetical protein N7470_003102 [Penicillium chermesinum]|nr:hypothetical protein N7470_003102 [Penicillium chermesinum]
MAGKRKRETTVASKPTDEKDASPEPSSNAQDVFRKYFEAQFEPLDIASSRPDKSDSDKEEERGNESDMDESGDSDWDGLSEDEESEGQVEVVEHKDAQVISDAIMDKKARKAFLKGKLPSEDVPKEKTAPKLSKEDEEDDHDNLKHDLALQRLLRESHLLESASDLAPTGKNRLKALDLRMQSLGAKTSLYKQEKMPTAHRRGIKAKASMKEEKRRRDAKENGIILEKPAKVSKSKAGRRERGVGGSSIGKFSGAR